MTRPAENQQTVDAAFGAHRWDCAAGGSIPPLICTCGLDAARAALRDLVAQAAAMAEVVDAARVVSEIERTGVLPDFQPLADALARLDGAR